MDTVRQSKFGWRRQWLVWLAAGTLLAVTPPAFGQAPAPETGAPPAAPEGQPEAKPSPPPETMEAILAPAYGNLDVSGSGADFFHYHRPPSGLFLNLLQILRRDAAGFPLQQLWWRNIDEADQKGYLDLHLRNLPSSLRLWHTTAEFYGDPRLPGRRFSDRDDTRVRLHLERLDPSPALDLFFWNQQVSIPAVARLQPGRGVDYHAPEVGLRAMLPVAQGQLSLEPRHVAFDNQTGRLRDSDTTWLTGEFVHPLGSSADVGLAYERISTSVEGRDDAVWNIFRLQGGVRPTQRLFVDAFFRQRGVNLPFTQTRYANRDSLVGLNVSAYPKRHSSLRAGLFRQDIRRIEGVTERTENTAWTGGWVQFRAWNPSLWNLSLRYRDKGLSNAPQARIGPLPSRDTLYYTRDQAVDARLDVFPTERVTPYLLWGWRERRNAERDTRLTLNTATLGATALVSPRLSLTAEFTQQLWDGNERPFRDALPGAPGGLPPQLFFSDARIFTGSLAYQLDRRSALDLVYNMFNSTGGQSARDHLAILQYRRDVSSGFFYSVGYQYENFSDNRRGRDYTAFPLLLQVGLRREFR